MSEIFAYKKFTDINLSPSSRETQHLLVINCAALRPFPSKRFSPRVECFELHASSWEGLSRRLNDTMRQEQAERIADGAVPVAAPQARYNLLPTRDSVYNEALNILLEYVRPDDLGITENSSPEEIRSTLEQKITGAKRDNHFSESLYAGLEKLLNCPLGARHYTLHYPALGETYITDNLPELVQHQLLVDAQRNYDSVIVLNGDTEVRDFIKEQGESLLKQIADPQRLKHLRHLDGAQRKIYSKKIVRAVEDWISAEKEDYPQAYAEFYRITKEDNNQRTANR